MDTCLLDSRATMLVFKLIDFGLQYFVNQAGFCGANQARLAEPEFRRISGWPTNTRSQMGPMILSPMFLSIIANTIVVLPNTILINKCLARMLLLLPASTSTRVGSVSVPGNRNKLNATSILLKCLFPKRLPIYLCLIC